jgi:hypothetical protein
VYRISIGGAITRERVMMPRQGIIIEARHLHHRPTLRMHQVLIQQSGGNKNNNNIMRKNDYS